MVEPSRAQAQAASYQIFLLIPSKPFSSYARWIGWETKYKNRTHSAYTKALNSLTLVHQNKHVRAPYPKTDWSGRSRRDGGTAHGAGGWRRRRRPAPSWASWAAARPPEAAAAGSSPPLDQQRHANAQLRPDSCNTRKRNRIISLKAFTFPGSLLLITPD